ncbi:DHH family phosphoesterase [Maridesulfovibrio hydrothermalis]|uniref:Phosphoesterase RecJ domain protein n=1 Tax=Maridesulfovibrio hydrothermalis AM13 = DSM 14728 TaxID=1121451 RepID=L0RB51_9BACT|nr:bifunctional oligoribonuclease/PAP phosphatase NrnA [Maridesulfovibrio hydrothermalis]CCO23974.1 Phosphoesterase RecJ domain protein [Maridesulfovibrio hydrothermalis AM13 = DSM 14728]
MEAQLKEICRILKEENDFLVAAHFNPDGDALGSTAALGYILESLGKRFRLYNQSGMPETMKWFSTPSPIQTEIPKGFEGWYIILDCGDAPRMGEPLMNAMDPEKSINIDHHMGNSDFAAVNWVDTNRPAVGEMITLIARELNISLAGKLGEAIYLSIATDTGFFTYGNTKPETLEIIADILRHGLKLEEFVPKIRNQWTMKRINLWTVALSKIELHHNGQTAMIFIPQEMMDETDAVGPDCEGLVSFILRIRDVRVAVLIREDSPLRYKFSLRSEANVDVQSIASLFCGGGHRNASGGVIENNPETVREKLIAAIGDKLAN